MDNKIQLSEIRLNYKIFPTSRPAASKYFVILPGWGGCSDSWAAVAVRLRDLGYTVVVPDWPGFGKTGEMSRPWSTDDFADLSTQFLSTLKIKNPTILGHSHGGRVLIKLLSRGQLKFDQVFLFASAGLPQQLNWKQSIARRAVPLGHLLIKIPLLGRGFLYLRSLIYRAIGGQDYLALPSAVMKQTMAKVLAEDLSPLLPRISHPIILLWGDRDTYTPLPLGRKMAQLFPNSELVIIPGARHGLHLQDPDRFFTLLQSHLR